MISYFLSLFTLTENVVIPDIIFIRFDLYHFRWGVCDNYCFFRYIRIKDSLLVMVLLNFEYPNIHKNIIHLFCNCYLKICLHIIECMVPLYYLNRLKYFSFCIVFEKSSIK